jgi:hypothetical protein
VVGARRESSDYRRSHPGKRTRRQSRLRPELTEPSRRKVYPAIVPRVGGVVNGVVYFDLPLEAWERLDAFEGEMYERSRLGVRGDGREWGGVLLLVKPEYRDLLTKDDWSFRGVPVSRHDRLPW